jgi:EAL domain-containing protein (putative c-di-GMP-specific phosphodiesterase class I)
MRALSAQEATVDAGIVLLPIRCTATARLMGFEVLARESETGTPASVRRDKSKYSPAAARQLAQVVSGEVASLIKGHGLKLWIPLSLEALRSDDSAIALFDDLAATELAGGAIIFDLEARDILSGVASANDDVLAALTWQDSRIAVSGLSDFTSMETLLADERISEVRLPAALCSKAPPPGFRRRPDESWLAEAVSRVHDRGLLASALDVSDSRLCHEIIVAGFDLIQGDLVGRPHSVEATIDQMVAALPFGRTLL